MVTQSIQKSGLGEAVAHAAHLLPAQFPLQSFVHHNTLHAFEHLPFAEGVGEAAKLFGAQPFMAEAAFAQHLASGRIQARDLDFVLPETAGEPALFEGAPTRTGLRRLWLRHPFVPVTGPRLRWRLAEGELLEAFQPGVSEAARRAVTGDEAAPEALAALWQTLERALPDVRVSDSGAPAADGIAGRTGYAVSELVHPTLIRLCASFLDQGVAYWRMPGKEQGLLRAVRDLYTRPMGPPEPWLRRLPARLAAQAAHTPAAEATVVALLDELEIPEDDWQPFIAATLLSLRGWAGMMHQLELRPDRAPVAAPPARLMDYLAVQLSLEAEALAYLRRRGPPAPAPREDPREAQERLLYAGFVLAQHAGISAAALARGDRAARWLDALAGFDELERRRLLHLAFERRHRVEVLDGLRNHARAGRPEAPPARIRAVFCMDDREESTRRHLEEVLPEVETFGYAGFFGVPMAYEGLDDVRPTPRCPVVIDPRHLVVEEPLDGPHEHGSAVGRLRHGVAISGQTMVRGSVVSGALGLATVVPLIGRVLFPRTSERISHAVMHGVGVPATRLALERPEGAPAAADGYLHGFTVEEMTGIVQVVLQTSGLTEARGLVVFVGHGSHSLNNPHEGAYQCGAAGGGPGGPNARAFATMANHPGVRGRLAQGGLTFPEPTWFVGASHDTGDDSMIYYDEDLIPEAVQADLRILKAAMEEARRRDAHERCRRFMLAPLDLDPEGALAHAEARTADLAQPRPELGHATNAVCIIGRRSRTRGLFLDRRAFLVSYDPTRDPDRSRLAALLETVGPVGAGINLEYYFSFVDSTGYGCGTKLPHNIVGLLGVMDGHASDLRTGLPWQMVEIHEPVRLLTIVEAEPDELMAIVSARPGLARLVVNGWIQVVAWSPSTDELHVFDGGAFRPHRPETDQLPVVKASMDVYRGHREHLPPTRVTDGLAPGGGAW
ncbi:MAG: DUF2309 domain-containing protein [Myxococcales bacterium]|nr:DUF2309 domain-containing protein [Myxococcales bacterium]